MSLLTKDEIENYLRVANRLPDAERQKVLALLEMDRVEWCKDSFLYFVKEMWPIFISGRHHAIMADAFERVAQGTLRRLIINMPPRHCLNINTPVLTTHGFKTIQSICVGDYVYSPNGLPVLVTGKSEVYIEQIYEVTTNDGYTIECDAEHLWTVKFNRNRITYSTAALLKKIKLQGKPQLPVSSNLYGIDLDQSELNRFAGKNRTISIVKTERTAEVQCIKVENEDGLFLAGLGLVPTHNTKSEFASYLLPAWFLGKYPEKKIIQCAHTSELAVGFGRKVRNLVQSPVYQKVFQTKLQSDSKAAGRWNTDKQGDYFAIGVGGAVTGKGADLLIIDDPHSEQEAKQGNPEVYNQTYEWFTSGPRQRLQPNGAVIIVMTRWAKRDLVGQIIKNSEKQGVDDWEVIEFPAIMPSGTPLWPAFWSKKELEAIKAEIPVSTWEAQYQQNPTSEEGAIIKRNMWKIWEKEDPPECEYLIQSWDTAFEKSNRADYSACTTWGIFYRENADGKMMPNIIVLDAFKRRMEFPELKEKALAMYNEWKPDSLIVEKKAAGAPLIYELRQMGIPLSEYTPSKGHDKIARVNSISDLFASGVVWCPETRWADELMEEMAAFPNGDHDDLVDSSSQALIRFRQGGFITLDSDYEDEKMQRRSVSYY